MSATNSTTGGADLGFSVGGSPTNGVAPDAGDGLGGSAVDAYALRGVYFKRAMFATPAECLTAAYRRGLPLDLCK